MDSGVKLDKKGTPENLGKKGVQKMLSKLPKLRTELKTLPIWVDSGSLPAKNIEGAREASAAMGAEFNYDSLKKQSVAAAEICNYIMNLTAYYDIVTGGGKARAKKVLVEEIQSGSDAITRNTLSDVLCCSSRPEEVNQIFIA